MKVYLGPYPHWWTVSRFEQWVTCKIHKTDYAWHIKEEDYTGLEKFIFKFTDAWQSVLNVTINKIGQKRKEKVVIHNYDTWSMDNTLSLMILPMLKQLRKDKHGAPLVDDKDVPVELRSTSVKKKKKKNEWDTDDNHFKRWDWILDEMIWAFEQKLADDDGRSNYYDPYKPNEKVEDSHFGDLETTSEAKERHLQFCREMGKFNKTKYQRYMKRKQKAFMLFGKYFEALWD